MKKQITSGKLKKADAKPGRTPWIAGLIVVAAVAMCLVIYKHSTPMGATASGVSASGKDSDPAPAGDAKNSPADVAGASAPAAKQVTFGPTVPNATPPLASATGGHGLDSWRGILNGGQEAPGMNDVGMKATVDSRPVHRVYIDGFFMDKTDVTNAQFERFVKATGYVTLAERNLVQKTILARRRRIWWLGQLSLRRPTILFHLTTICNGGRICRVQTGVIRLDREQPRW